MHKKLPVVNVYHDLLESIPGEDPHREGLIKTPQRANDAFNHLTKGYTESLDELIRGAIFDSKNDELVMVQNIEFYSLCEHHMLPFFGKCHIGYLPKGKIIGLSKLARIVEHFSRRLQVQENLTEQIAQALEDILAPKGVGVIMEAQHLCMMMRGVEKQGAYATTSSMRGALRNRESTRLEFLSLLRRG